MTNKPTVSKSWVETVILSAEKYGIARAKLFARAKVLPDSVMSARLAVDDITRLWRAAGELTADPGFGLKTGLAVGPASLNVVSYILLSAPTLRHAISQLQSFQRLISDGGRFQLMPAGEQSWLIYHPVQGELAFSHHQIEAVLASVVQFSQWVSGRSAGTVSAQFAHGMQAAPAEYLQVFGKSVVFDGAFNGLLLDNDFLDTPLPQADSRLAQAHASIAATELAALAEQGDLEKQLRLWMRTAPGATRGTAAAALALSERQLAHRLDCLDLNYQSMMDEVRDQLAREYLRIHRLSITKIASRLGYSESSAFCRAFKRREGTSPHQWRRNNTLTQPDGMP